MISFASQVFFAIKSECTREEQRADLRRREGHHGLIVEVVLAIDQRSRRPASVARLLQYFIGEKLSHVDAHWIDAEQCHEQTDDLHGTNENGDGEEGREGRTNLVMEMRIASVTEHL